MNIENESLQDLHLACEHLVKTDEEIAKKKSELADLESIKRQLSSQTIPEIMEEMGVRKLELSNGNEISYKSDIVASVSHDRMALVTQWLEEHGFGDLIKTSVNVQFPRCKLEDAQRLEAELIKAGYDASLEETVHVMTLKAWLKEQLAAGADIPLDLFGAFQTYKTTIKHSK